MRRKLPLSVTTEIQKRKALAERGEQFNVTSGFKALTGEER